MSPCKSKAENRQVTGAAFPIKAFKDRDDWIIALLASELSCTAKIIATRIALHHNIETGRCDPSIATLAAGAGVSKNTVLRSLRESEQAGWVHISRSRGGR